MKRLTRRLVLSALLFCVSQPLAGQEFTSGTYRPDGGDYTIHVQAHGENLILREPTRISTYLPIGEGRYQYENPTNGRVYVFKVIDEKTIESHREGTNPSTWRLVSADMGVPAELAELPRSESQMIADRYADLAITDPTNTHVWTACAAMAGSGPDEDEAILALQRQTLTMLKQIMNDPGTTPCPDAIPQTFWDSLR